jgi:hypothetical protein
MPALPSALKECYFLLPIEVSSEIDMGDSFSGGYDALGLQHQEWRMKSRLHSFCHINSGRSTSSGAR